MRDNGDTPRVYIRGEHGRQSQEDCHSTQVARGMHGLKGGVLRIRVKVATAPEKQVCDDTSDTKMDQTPCGRHAISISRG